MGLSLIFFSLHFCLTFCVCLIFLSLSLSISFSIFSTVLLCIFTSFYILPHFTPLTLLPFESIQFLFDFRNIYSLSINFLTHFFFSFFSLLFFLNCFSSFLLCLIYSTLLSPALPPSPPSLPNPLSVIPYVWLQVLQLWQSETLQEGWSGVEGDGAGEGLGHMDSSHPASRRRRILPVQVLGQWFLSTGWGEFYLNVGMSHEN